MIWTETMSFSSISNAFTVYLGFPSPQSYRIAEVFTIALELVDKSSSWFSIESKSKSSIDRIAIETHAMRSEPRNYYGYPKIPLRKFVHKCIESNKCASVQLLRMLMGCTYAYAPTIRSEFISWLGNYIRIITYSVASLRHVSFI